MTPQEYIDQLGTQIERLKKERTKWIRIYGTSAKTKLHTVLDNLTYTWLPIKELYVRVRHHLSKQYLYLALDRLEEQGLIERAARPNRKHRSLVRLTQEAARILDAEPPVDD